MQKLGTEGTKGESPALRLRITPELQKALEAMAKKDKTTVSALVRRFIEEGVKRG